MINQIKNFFAKSNNNSTIEDKSQEVSVAFLTGDSLMQGINPDEAKLTDYDSMRYDEQVNVCLEVRVQAMLAKGWTIQPVEGKEDIAKEIEANFNNLKGSFYQTLKQIELQKKVFGFSLSEILWQNEKGKLKIAGIKTRNSRLIKFYPDKYGNLLEEGIRQEVDGQEINLPEEKMILHINNMENSNYFGVSDLKSGYVSWVYKKKLMSLYNLLLERFGIPPIIMKYDPSAQAFIGLTEEQTRKKLEGIALTTKKTHQGGVIMIPDYFAHDIVQLDTGGAQAFENALDRYDFAISKAMKVPSELGFLNTKVGSNAKASTQFDVFLWVVNQDNIELEEAVNEQLIKRYVIYNYGLQDEYPKFKLNPVNDDDIEQIIKLYNEALKAGAVRPTKSGEAKTLDLLKYPAVNEDEILETKPQPDNNLPNPDPNNPEEKPKKKVFSKTKYNGEELSPAEKKVNFSKIDSFFMDKEDKAIAEFSDIAYKIFIDISNKIVNKKIITEKRFDEIEKLTIQGSLVGDIKKLLQFTLGQAYKEGKSSILDELNIKKSFAISASELPEPEYFLWIQTLSKEIAGELAGEYLAETKQILLMGIQGGTSEKKIIQQLDEAYKLAKSAGSIQTPAITQNRVGTIVRTNINAAFNKARHNEVIKINEETKDTYYKVFSEILDGRSHPFSAFIHGKAVKVGSDLDKILNYPLHYQDRGVAVYVNATVEGEPPNILTQLPNLQGYSGLLIR